MNNSPEAILDWLKNTVNKTNLPGEWKRPIIREGQGKICLGELRGDLSQWLAGMSFEIQPKSTNEVSMPSVVVTGKEIFEGLYL